MTYIIIGSGIAGVNAAMTLLERGKQVEIWDADLAGPSYLNKSNVPESYYGENLKGIIESLRFLGIPLGLIPGNK